MDAENESTDGSRKRNASPLFVEEDSALQSTDAHVTKRTKTANEATADNASPNEGVNVSTGSHVAPYDAFKKEGRPQLAIYHPSFTEAEKLVTTVCNNFIEVVMELQGEDYENEEIMEICTTKLDDLRNLQMRYPDVLPIACLGPAGVGKSSAINCIISQQAVAVESDWGGRGTNIVHEYKAAKPHQLSEYVIDVRYMQKKQVENLIKKHCKAILDLVNLTQEEKQEMDSDELTDMQKKHDTAIDFFYTILCDQDDFDSPTAIKDFFQDRRGDLPLDTKEELVTYVWECISTKSLTENIETFCAESEAELNNLFAQITGTRTDQDGERLPSLWPLIVTVTVHRDRDLLNAGVVLADTPGVTDTNLSIVQSTKNYLKQAGTILVFANPSRIIQNPDLDTNLRECMGMGKMHSTYLLVTSIDQKSTFKETEKANLPADDREILQEAEDNTKQIKVEIRKAIKERDEATNFDHLKACGQRLAELEIKDIAAGKRVRQVCIEIRNRMIQREVKNKFRELLRSPKAPDLNAFFISNTEYQKHLAGYDRKDPPTLDLQATGIPEVRRMLYSVPARGKVNRLSVICGRRLLNIFRGIEGILTKSRLERKQDVEKLIIRVFEEDDATLRTAAEDVKARFTERVITAIKSNEPRWKGQAVKLLETWQEYNTGTFTAFCRRGGSWQLPKSKEKKIKWNHEIQNIFAPKLTGAFDSLEEDLDNIEDTTIMKVNNLYQKLEEELQMCKDFQGVDEKPFFEHIRGVRAHVTAELADLFETLKENVNQIGYATTLNNEESNVALGMHDTYLECLKISSTNYDTNATLKTMNKKGRMRERRGAHPTRVELIRKRLTGEGDGISIFAAIARRAADAFDEDVASWAAKSRKQIRNAAADVQKDFNRRFDVADNGAEENQEAIKTLLTAADHALEIIEGPMQEHLERCKAYEEAAR